MQTPRFSTIVLAAALVAPTLIFASDTVPGQDNVEVSDDGRAASTEHKPSASKNLDCRTLVQETTAACRDWIERGLDVNCYGKLISIDVNRAQAAGNLFEEGASRRWTVDGTCELQVRTLRKQRAKKDQGMRPEGSAGPKCQALAVAVQTRCFDDLGKEKLSGSCKKILRAFDQASDSDAESECAYAAGMLQ